MNQFFNDEFHGIGGSFEVRDGKRVRIDQEQTRHPDGDRARDPDGNPHDKPQENAPALPTPTYEAAADDPGSARRRIRTAE